jgi:hypothetical protein
MPRVLCVQHWSRFASSDEGEELIAFGTHPLLFSARLGATPSAALEDLLGDVHRLGHVELEILQHVPIDACLFQQGQS